MCFVFFLLYLVKSIILKNMYGIIAHPYTVYNLISNVTKKLYNFPESAIFQIMMDYTQERHSNSDRK